MYVNGEERVTTQLGDHVWDVTLLEENWRCGGILYYFSNESNK